MGKEKLKYKIREPKEKDIDQIIEIFRDFIGIGWSKEKIKSWIRSSDVLLVAETKGKIIGFIFTQFNKPTKKATIENLIVRRKYRKRGIGTALLKQCLKELKKKGANYICALVRIDNKSTIKFLMKRKFHRGYNFTWLEKII